MQGFGPAFHDNPKGDLILDGEFLLDPGKCLFQIQGTARRRAQAPSRVPALLKSLFPSNAEYGLTVASSENPQASWSGTPLAVAKSPAIWAVTARNASPKQY
jgi:hypothetical protein